MDLQLDSGLAEGYSSGSQKARVLTESWLSSNMYCPLCGHVRIVHFSNNKTVADFYCPSCNEQYELKSMNGTIGKKVADGAYDSFVQRITESTNPDFLFMSYRLSDMRVYNLSFVPKFFFVPSIAEKRKPLGEHAKRHGWVGCNILYDQIPLQGRVEIIRQGTVVEKETVLDHVRRAYMMKVDDLETRGWLFDVLNCVNAIAVQEFTLDHVYRFERLLGAKHPENHHIRPKVRQQLQVLRDRGVLEFLGNGRYRKAI